MQRLKPAEERRQATNGLVTIDRQEFGDAFARRPCAVRHSLVDHPLFTLDAIADLAASLPMSSIERHPAKQPLVVPGVSPDFEGSPAEIARNIETNGAWMVLWYIHRVPEYGRILDDCLDEVSEVIPPGARMCRREAFLFLSAPNALTPVHFDPEHNLLLQVRGTKEMNVVLFSDREAELKELDRSFDGGGRNLTAMPDGEVFSFPMQPGQATYVPPFAPHWVQNGPAASISLSITFRTRLSQRHEHVHWFNARLRHLHLSPHPPGDSEARDMAKAGVVRTWAASRRLAGRALRTQRQGRRG
jgi:hypothetical protein